MNWRSGGVADNTIVIFMGDNGAALLRGKGTLYDLGLHVPLIVAGPGVASGASTSALISGIDIAPTVLELAGLTVPDTMSGKSFLSALRGEPYTGHEYIFGARVPHGTSLPKSTSAFDLSRTVFNERYKLIYNTLWQLPYAPVDFGGHPAWKELQAMNQQGILPTKYERAFFAEPRSMFELYDLQQDPNEFNNLSGDPDYADEEQHLKEELHEWMMVYQDYLPLPIPPTK